MNHTNHYYFLNHLDAPKRYLSLTIDELIVASVGFMLLICSPHKIMVALFSMGLVSALRMLKKGHGPKILLLLAYWYLPGILTGFFLPKLPSSHHRIWKA